MYDAASCQHVCLNKNAVWRSARWLYRLVTAAQSHSEAVYIRVHGYEQSDVCTQFFFFSICFAEVLSLKSTVSLVSLVVHFELHLRGIDSDSGQR